MEKYGRAGEATYDMAHTLGVLENRLYMHTRTHKICIILFLLYGNNGYMNAIH